MAFNQKTPTRGNQSGPRQGSFKKEGGQQNQENRKPYNKNNKTSFSRGYQSTIYHKTQVDIQPRARGTVAEGSKRFGPSTQEEGKRAFVAAPKRDQDFNRDFNRKGGEGSYKGKGPQGRNFQNKNRQEKPYQGKSNQGRPQNRSFQEKDGEKRPYQNRSQNRPFQERDGEKRPYQNRNQNSSFQERREGQQRPYQNKTFKGGPSGGNDFKKRSDSPSPVGIREENKKPSYKDFQYQKPGNQPVLEQENLENDQEDVQSIILAGRNPIREALKSGRDLEKLLVQKGELSGSAKEIVMMAKNAQVPVQIVEKIRLDAIAPHHQGLIAYGSAFAYSSLEDILAVAEEKKEAPFIVLLDGITDPHNLGAIIRSAECAGAHGVIVPQRRSVGLTPAAVKASAGAVEYIKVARVTNLVRTIELLQSKDIWVFGADSEGKNYREVDFRGACALVVGAEGEGISKLVKTKCDQMVSLPIMGNIDSLNASVATGVLLYRILETR